jgi:hypothetical protein
VAVVHLASEGESASMLYKELVASGTYVLKTGPGYLQGITVNIPGGGTLQIADQTTAAAPFIAGATAFALPTAGVYLDYDCHFTTALTIVIGSMSGGSITVEFI